MPLSTYNRRRNFRKTPEPKGLSAKPGQTLRFVVQKHDASHLHYDLRLELDGVMKSWAIPKGPSLNPTDKHLAVLVEDHPISYNTFEGHIPEGNYGAGDVIVWDAGTYHAETATDSRETERDMKREFKKGHLLFFLEGKKLRGLFNLVRLKNSDTEWLLIKQPDEFVSTDDVTKDVRSVLSNRSLTGRHERIHTPLSFRAKPQRSRGFPSTYHSHNLSDSPRGGSDTSTSLVPRSGSPRRSLWRSTGRNDRNTSAHIPKISPMLATLVDEPFDSPDWLFELKWDGYRALAEVQKGKVKLYSRRGTSFNKKFSSIALLLSQIAEDVLLDGEIVAVDKKGAPSFQSLQEVEEHGSNLKYVVFDLLYLSGQNIMDWPLTERKTLLKAFVKKYPFLTYSVSVDGKGPSLFKTVAKKNLEGIVAKRKDSVYQPGVRSRDWLKIKHHQTDEAIIAGFTSARGARGYFGALVLAQYQGGNLEFIGHTGTGFSQDILAKLYKKMKKMEIKTSPFSKKIQLNSPVTWIKPVLVAQIKISERTNGGSLRQPVFLGLREDKRSEEITGEETLTVIPSEATSQPRNRFVPAKHALRDSSTKLVHRSGSPRRSLWRSAGRNDSFTHLDKVYFPKLGLTKGDVIAYYQKIAPYILPYLKDRPEALNRHPHGEGKPNFFQKNYTAPTPPFVQTARLPNDATGELTNYLLCQNKETLLYLANLGCIELNPWNSRIDSVDYPDYLVIDLDPDDNTWAELVTVAKVVKKILDLACLKSYIKTSGKTGLHIYVPLGARYHFEDVRKFSELLVNLVHERLPELTSVERPPAKRKRKIYLDFLQNRLGQTLAAPYSLRPVAEATVSTPLRWSELTTRLDPKKFTLKTIFQRLKKYGDIWQGMLRQKNDVKKSIRCLERTVLNKKSPNT